MYPVILEGLNRLMYCIDRCGVSRESVECERRASARLLSKRGMNWLLVEQIEIAAGDETAGKQERPRKERPDQKLARRDFLQQ